MNGVHIEFLSNLFSIHIHREHRENTHKSYNQKKDKYIFEGYYLFVLSTNRIDFRKRYHTHKSQS